jgi:hypothetical protein
LGYWYGGLTQTIAECGDVNESGNVDIDDIIYLIHWMFTGGPAPNRLDMANTNCLEEVDIDDIVYLINYLFQGGYAPCDPDGDGNPDC